MSYSLSSYDYVLPKEKIAQEAASPAHNAKLLIFDKNTGNIDHEGTFFDIAKIIPNDRVFFFNNSQVLRARILLENATYTTENGVTGIIKDGEILFLRLQENGDFEALVRPGAKFRDNTTISLWSHKVMVVWHTNEGRLLRVTSGAHIFDILEDVWQLPLPPYIEYTKEKEASYQNIFGSITGSVAAPTAGLHFTEELLAAMPHEREEVTLHVWLGTFQSIQTEDIRDFAIHEEMIECPLQIFARISEIKKKKESIVAVGTTSCRTLESLPWAWQSLDPSIKWTFTQEVQDFWNQKQREKNPTKDLHTNDKSIYFSTAIYIYPGKDFAIVDELVTNFHVPKSSLLVLVSAFSSENIIQKIYAHALRSDYRFLSLGDGMYIRSKNLKRQDQ